MARRGLMVVVAVVLTVLSQPVGAQEALPATPDQALKAVASAETDLERALAQSSGDCVAACVALASMKRAAARLCQLEPGPRCDAARKRVEAARQRVAERCPGCKALREATGDTRPTPQPGPGVRPAPEPPPPPRPPEPKPDDDDDEGVDGKDEPKVGEKAAGKQVEPRNHQTESVVVTAEAAPMDAPPSEDATGGCAACRLGGAGDPRGLWALALAALALVLRRR